MNNTKSSSPKGTILIVDDDDINQAILKAILEEQYEILTAQNGMVAESLIFRNRDKLDMVLLDVIMPIVDGFGVLKFMNDKKLIDKIPVVLITAEATASNVIRGFQLGASDILAKPFDSKIISNRIANLIALHRHLNLEIKEDKERPIVLSLKDQVLESSQLRSLLASRFDLLELADVDHVAQFAAGNVDERAVILMLNFSANAEQSKALLNRLTEEYLLGRCLILIMTKDILTNDIVELLKNCFYDVVNEPYEPEVIFRRLGSLVELSNRCRPVDLYL